MNLGQYAEYLFTGLPFWLNLCWFALQLVLFRVVLIDPLVKVLKRKRK